MSKINRQISLAEIKKHLSDRLWRLNNLYFIKDENGHKVQFKLNPTQKKLHDELWYFNIIPKARQLGITSFFTILYLDQVLFSENKTASIIAHRQEDMKKIFKHKIKFAWDHLHPWLKQQIGTPNTETAQEITFPNGSSISVSLSTRSSTVQLLHVSEFGYICQKFPEKAEEIVTGAINSVHPGNMVSIESTAAGKEGYFYEFCMEAERARKEGRRLSPLDFKIHFFPWWIDSRYQLTDSFIISQADQEYFTTLKDKHGITLTEPQKRWYVKKKKLNRDKMMAEYPSTLDEAFATSVEGAYYAKEMSRVYRDKRIRPLPYDPLKDVETWWDLGMNDFNVVVAVQTYGSQIRFLNMYWNSGESLAHYYDKLLEWKQDFGYRYSRHVLPHDVEVREMNSGLSRKDTLYNLGLRNIRVSPKLGLQEGIDRVRILFPRFHFDEEKTQRLHDALFNYRKDWDKKLGAWKNSPRHDDNSHFADAVRIGCAVWQEEYLTSDDIEEAGDQAFF